MPLRPICCFKDHWLECEHLPYVLLVVQDIDQDPPSVKFNKRQLTDTVGTLNELKQ